MPRELCAAFVLLWGINPESFLYNWAIYALVVLLWAGFAMASQWKLFWQTTLHPAMLLSFGWPVLLAMYAVAGHVEFPFHHLLMQIFYLMLFMVLLSSILSFVAGVFRQDVAGLLLPMLIPVPIAIDVYKRQILKRCYDSRYIS